MIKFSLNLPIPNLTSSKWNTMVKEHFKCKKEKLSVHLTREGFYFPFHGVSRDLAQRPHLYANNTTGETNT